MSVYISIKNYKMVQYTNRAPVSTADISATISLPYHNTKTQNRHVTSYQVPVDPPVQHAPQLLPQSDLPVSAQPPPASHPRHNPAPHPHHLTSPQVLASASESVQTTLTQYLVDAVYKL